jgi:hypothetical protein
MHSRTKLALATLTTTILMTITVTTATAGRLSTSNTRFRFTWNSLAFVENGEAGTGIQQSCRVTLEGSFHSATIRKLPSTLVGSVTRAIADSTNCRGTNEPHRLTFLQEVLPWHVTYESFAGTLPNITSLTFLVRKYAWQISATVPIIGTITCLYADAGRLEENLAGQVTRNIVTGELTEDDTVEGRRARFLRGSALCPEFGRLSGQGQVFLLGNSTRIRITLI